MRNKRLSLSDLTHSHSLAGAAAETRAQPATAVAPPPPYSNTGGIEPYQRRQSASAYGAFVDWLNFTFKCTSFNEVSDHCIVLKVSKHLTDILGYSVTDKRPSGLNCYQSSYVLGNHWGFVCIGGQNDTAMVSITGAGCMAAKAGWEQGMFEYLPTLHRARITRIDLAHDFFDGEYTPDQALTDFHAGLFSLGARMPDIETRGNWVNPNGKGRTLNIGNRNSGKMARIYEKGLQLGHGFSEMFPNWVRVEGELHNQDREIPFDTLIHPGQYLAGLYPAFAFIHSQQTRIQTKKSTVKVTYDAAVNTLKHQFGPLLHVMLEIEGSAESVIERVAREGMPKRLNLVTMDHTQALPALEDQPFNDEQAFALMVNGLSPKGGT